MAIMVLTTYKEVVRFIFWFKLQDLFTITWLLNYRSLIFFKHTRSHYIFYLLTVDVEVVYFHLITLKHTPQSVGLLWRRDRPVAEISTWQHKHCTRQTPKPPVVFEPTIPASSMPQT
jgi:hypothetical protein